MKPSRNSRRTLTKCQTISVKFSMRFSLVSFRFFTLTSSFFFHIVYEFSIHFSQVLRYLIPIIDTRSQPMAWRHNAHLITSTYSFQLAWCPQFSYEFLYYNDVNFSIPCSVLVLALTRHIIISSQCLFVVYYNIILTTSEYNPFGFDLNSRSTHS